MTAIFSPERFLRLCRAQWLENRREYLWFGVTVAALHLLFMVVMVSSRAGWDWGYFKIDNQEGTFGVGLFLSGVVFAGRYFRGLHRSGDAVIVLMRPASHVEKWLAALWWIALWWPLCFTLLFLLLHVPPTVWIEQALALGQIQCEHCRSDVRPFLPFLFGGAVSTAQWRIHSGWLLMFWAAQAWVVGGTLFFRRSAILSTAVVSGVVFFLLMALNVSPTLGPFWTGTDWARAQCDTTQLAVSAVVWLGLPLFLWLACLFHLKARELS